MTAVLDASALLAWLQDEPGASVVRERLDGGIVSAANWSEVLQKIELHGRDATEAGILLEALGIEVADVTKEDGEEAARLWAGARHLSLADRLCLAAGKRLGAEVLTADSAWLSVDDRISVTVIR